VSSSSGEIYLGRSFESRVSTLVVAGASAASSTTTFATILVRASVLSATRCQNWWLSFQRWIELLSLLFVGDDLRHGTINLFNREAYQPDSFFLQRSADPHRTRH
jgi:hypothetical protein